MVNSKLLTLTGGAGSLAVSGAGSVVLSAANTYTGGTILSGGAKLILGNPTLLSGSPAAAGGGAITFVANSKDTLTVYGTTMPTNTIAGFTLGDTIDLAGIAFNASSQIGYDGSHLTVTTVGGTTLARLNVSGLTVPPGNSLVLAKDSSSGTAIIESAPPLLS